MAKKSINLLIGVTLLCVGTLLSVVAVSIYGWAKADNPYTILSLWQVCVEIGSMETCDDIQDVSGSLESARRMAVGAVINNGISVFFAIYFTLKTKMTGIYCSRSMVLTSLITGLVSVALTITTLAVYGSSYEDDFGDRFNLAHAFHMFVAAGSCILTGCINVFCSFTKGSINPGCTISTTTTVLHEYPMHHTGPAFVSGNQPPPYGPPAYPAYGQPGGPASYPGGYPTAYPYPAPQYQQKDPAYPPPPPMAY